MMMKLNKETLIAGSLFAANTIYFIEALQLPAPFEQGEPGPGFYPLVLAAIMYVACIRLLLSSLKDKKKGFFKWQQALAIRPLSIAGATAIFILLFETLGYWAATLLYTFAVALIFEYGRKYSLGFTMVFCTAIATVITGAGWLFFDLLFDLHLPKGML